ncbi:MAG TPA: M56 family metallopeptidase [Candidatus Binatia bacterium]|jgi:beta-lactamase regulating signal transducer with metallopeptidase domain|nr:M56 family metallopeptidase [Candidatus Binatia bacterium]
MGTSVSNVFGIIQHSGFAALFLDALLKSFVVLVAAGGICLCWRRAAAATRHLVWCLAVAGVLCLPGLSLLLPGWQKPLWAVGAYRDTGNQLTLTFVLAPTKTIDVRERASASPRADTSRANQLPTGSQHLTTHFNLGWFGPALGIWMSGVGLLLGLVTFGRLRLWALRRRAGPFCIPEWAPLLRALCDELQIRRQVALLQSYDEVMPVTWGWWRPVILLPAEAEEWPAERRRVVLLHELAHVKRWDCLTQMLARVACALYWLNPLVWVAARRMCIERERACDDLVLNGGCKASDYASHLVEIASRFRRVPQVAAIAMARSSQLKSRIAAIVDASRTRRVSHPLVLALGCVAVLGLVAVAAQKPEADPGSLSADNQPRPWFDARLRAFFTAKAAQAHQLAEAAKKPVAREVWPYFDAGIKGDWTTATNLWVAMRRRAHQYEGTTADDTLDDVWSPILETDLAWEQFANWQQKYVLAYGNDIINSIPPGSIYFGGTDPGRGLPTAMSENHAEAKPFFTLTQNALADGTYLDYLREMYGARIYTPTAEDSKRCFDEYTTDAAQRLKDNKLKPGEDVKLTNGRVEVQGQVAVMAVNALIAKIIFDRNPDREFYIEESFPLDWMYPHLSPNGLIMKINREPLTELSDEMIQQDHDYWSNYVQQMIGGWLNYDTPVSEVAAFAGKAYGDHDLSGFAGDPLFVQDSWSEKAFSKERSSIGGLYAWRANDSKDPAEKQRMTKEADFAFRQAFALCPTSPEVVFRYVNLLLPAGRTEDARLIAETALKLDPKNKQFADLVQNVRNAGKGK